MSKLLEQEARMKTEAVFIRNHQDEFDEIHRETRVKNGLDLVTVRRTVVRQVTPMEALVLVRHGWERVEND